MLSSYSWHGFLSALFPLIFSWYFIVLGYRYRKPLWNTIRRWLSKKPPAAKSFWPIAISLLVSALLIHDNSYAQTADGNAGLAQANATIRSYWDILVQIMYAIGAIIGLISAIGVYSRLTSHRENEITKHVGLWFGACLFLVIAASVLRSFFGI